MAETRFTPGPWRAEVSEYGSDGYEISLSVVDQDEQTIASVWLENFDLPDPETARNNGWADAMLIAAAPDLVDALVAALPYVETAEDDPTYKLGAVAKVVKHMRAAIAKATGEKNG